MLWSNAEGEIMSAHVLVAIGTRPEAIAMTAFHLRLPVGHVEAGLRTGSILSPYPEELNRQVISRIAAFHLAPTDTNEQNLVREGV